MLRRLLRWRSNQRHDAIDAERHDARLARRLPQRDLFNDLPHDRAQGAGPPPTNRALIFRGVTDPHRPPPTVPVHVLPWRDPLEEVGKYLSIFLNGFPRTRVGDDASKAGLPGNALGWPLRHARQCADFGLGGMEGLPARRSA